MYLWRWRSVRAAWFTSNATEHPTAEWTLQQLREALPGDREYKFLLHDRHKTFSVGLDEEVASWGIEVLKSPPSRPVVHFPYGTYSIADTLTVPICDLQLVGDGYGTILRWTGGGAGPLLRVMGPSKATLRDIQIDGMKKADGILMENVDQIGSRVYMDQVQL